MCVCVCERERERERERDRERKGGERESGGGGQANQHHWLHMPTLNLESTVVAMQMSYYCTLLSNNILCEVTVT